jgi:hypothetical protein
LKYRWVAIGSKTYQIDASGKVEVLLDTGWWKYFTTTKLKNRRDIVKEIRRINNGKTNLAGPAQARNRRD